MREEMLILLRACMKVCQECPHSLHLCQLVPEARMTPSRVRVFDS